MSEYFSLSARRSAWCAKKVLTIGAAMSQSWATTAMGTASASVVSYEAPVLMERAVARAAPTTTLGGVVVPMPLRPIQTSSSSPPMTRPFMGSPMTRPTIGPMMMGRSSMC